MILRINVSLDNVVASAFFNSILFFASVATVLLYDAGSLLAPPARPLKATDNSQHVSGI